MRNLLVLTDYPIGYQSGFGETLFNLLQEYPDKKIWNAHPHHLKPAPGKAHGQSYPFIAPLRPKSWPERLNTLYYPVLKLQQAIARSQVFRMLSNLVEKEGIDTVLTCPVSPWLLSVALKLKQSKPNLNLVIFVMDDWEGHHQSFGLPYTYNRRKTLANIIALSEARFGVSIEMVQKYEKEFCVPWDVLHNGVSSNQAEKTRISKTQLRCIRLTGDVNIFRMDAVLNFARGIELYNRTADTPSQFEITGTIATDCVGPLESLQCVTLLSRTDHAACLKGMAEADLLYLPLSFDPTVKRIAELSLPTKLPEYLNTGKPIFFHAPQSSAVYQFAERWNLEPRLDCASPESVCDKLKMFASGHYDLAFDRMQAGLNAEFNLNLLRQRLYSAL